METDSMANHNASESSPPSTEPTDEDLREKVRRARELAASMGGMVAYVPEAPQGLQVHRIRGRGETCPTWRPPCLTCGAEIGYEARDGAYGAQLECDVCRGASIGACLASSGISAIEMDQPLEDLKMHGPDGVAYTDYQHWLVYLKAFAGMRSGLKITPPFAFVCGTNGVGKSAGAQRALRDAVRNGCKGRFVRASTILREIYSTYGTDEDTNARYIEYAKMPLLVVDEIGGEHASAHGIGLFFDLVDDRWRNARPTIFTSNYLPQRDSLGARIQGNSDDDTRMRGILDRIIGGSRGNLFIIRGKSWRGMEPLFR